MFKARIENVKQKLLKEKLDAVLVSSVSNITYLTGYANFSKDERDSYLFIGNDFAYIITDGRYTEAVKKQVPHITLFERKQRGSIEELFKKHKSKIKKLGIEEDSLTVAEAKIISKHFKNIRHFEVAEHRAIKTKDEIKKIEAAAKIGDKAFAYILKKIRPGISEKELAFEIEIFIKKIGAELSFPSIVAFGKNSSIPHHQTGQTVLEGKKGQFVLLDFGVKLENYCSDMTRIVFFGSPTDQQKKIYEAVLKSQQKAIDFINSSLKENRKVLASEADKTARDYLISQGYPTIPHSLGHGIGLEVHEHPFLSSISKEILQEGMVFSIEPGVYLEGFGGVRIEDLFVLEKSGLRQLTNSSKEIISL